MVGHRIWYIEFFFGLQESRSESTVHGSKGLSGLGEYGNIECRNCIKFILRRRNSSFSKTGGQK